MNGMEMTVVAPEVEVEVVAMAARRRFTQEYKGKIV